MKRLMVVCAFVLIACGGSSQNVHPVQARAPFDLGCPAEQMRYLQIDSKTVGAQGCGKRVTYVKVCRGGVLNVTVAECQWVMDSARN